MNKIPNSMVRRCPRLGNPVPFDYCETCGDEKQPCFKILDCWWEHFDVVRYLKDHLTEDQYNQLLQARPKSKVTSLVELIEQARKRINQRSQAENGATASSGGLPHTPSSAGDR